MVATILLFVRILKIITGRYNFNDSHVSPADPKDAVDGSAYVLFYKRRYVLSRAVERERWECWRCYVTLLFSLSFHSVRLFVN